MLAMFLDRSLGGRGERQRSRRDCMQVISDKSNTMTEQENAEIIAWQIARHEFKQTMDLQLDKEA